MAYALALSIKNTQKTGYDKVALVIDDIQKLNTLSSQWVFDQVIEWNEQQGWDGRSWMDSLTPWDYTVCLDVDMLFFRDHSHVIESFIEEDTELFLPSTVFTYRGEQAVDNHYRKAFRKNLLPNLYSFFTFFKKDSRLVKNFFSLGRHIIKKPIEFSNVFLTKYKPKVIGTDEAFALSAKILDIDHQITYSQDFLKVVHLKPMIQNWPWPADSTFNHVGFYFDNNAQVKIGNFQQFGILHYVDKELLTDEHISILERKVWNK
jgi:hypothetical protein